MQLQNQRVISGVTEKLDINIQVTSLTKLHFQRKKMSAFSLASTSSDNDLWSTIYSRLISTMFTTVGGRMISAFHKST